MTDLKIDFHQLEKESEYEIESLHDFNSSIVFIEPGAPESSYNGQQRDIYKNNHYKRTVSRKHVKREKRRIFLVDLCISNKTKTSGVFLKSYPYGRRRTDSRVNLYN